MPAISSLLRLRRACLASRGKGCMETDTHESEFEAQSTRASFIKRLAKTAAVGLGIALLPASGAFARSQSGGQCCRNSDHCPQWCGTNQGWAYWCSTNCYPSSCCVGCVQNEPACYNITYCIC